METKDRAALSRQYVLIVLPSVYFLLTPKQLSSYVQELEARLLYMEQLFKQHAPHIEVFPPEGSGLPSEFSQSGPGLVKTFVPGTNSQVEMKQEELDDSLLMHDNDGEPAPLTEHFGQMALDSEGHLR